MVATETTTKPTKKGRAPQGVPALDRRGHLPRDWFAEGNRAVRVAAYVCDGWTPAALRAMARAVTSGSNDRLSADACALEEFLTAHGLRPGTPVDPSAAVAKTRRVDKVRAAMSGEWKTLVEIARAGEVSTSAANDAICGLIKGGYAERKLPIEQTERRKNAGQMYRLTEQQ